MIIRLDRHRAGYSRVLAVAITIKEAVAHPADPLSLAVRLALAGILVIAVVEQRRQLLSSSH